MDEELERLQTARAFVNESALAPERTQIERMVQATAFDPALRNKITARATILVGELRRTAKASFLQSFLSEYGLSTGEGVALMSMAEAFLRVPDADTLDDLIMEKVTGSNWQSHSGQAPSFLVNASTWALMLTGRILNEEAQDGLVPAMRDLVRRLGEPVIRVAMTEAMEQLGNHYVVGTSIDHALRRTSKDPRYDDYSFSFDMLGESALTEEDAQDYFESYKAALRALAEESGEGLSKNSGISVKLSALHPRFELTQKTRCFDLLFERMSELCRMAAEHNLNLNIDGEEVERMSLTLDIFAALAEDPRTKHWQGLGLVVQAYARNAHATIDWLKSLARQNGRMFMVRLVKGAYWDTEIKRAQVYGLPSYPVFTRKPYTDISFLCAAEKLLTSCELLFPQFATHNAHTVTAVNAMAVKLGVSQSRYEFQRLYGMGEQLHEICREQNGTTHRIYAPVGKHEDLLAYLVRRLLENGANSSFVHQLTDDEVPIENIAADPFTDPEIISWQEPNAATCPAAIPEPWEIYPDRKNSMGYDLSSSIQLDQLDALREPWRHSSWSAHPLLAKKTETLSPRQVINPALPYDALGSVEDTSDSDIEFAIAYAVDQSSEWSQISWTDRADRLSSAADLYEAAFGELSALLIREAGKTMSDVVGEWREAIDFLRYYAQQARSNSELQQRTSCGVFLCIAPWNFPLSIFTGQIAAALVTGNTVLAKPAEQSSLVAFRATQLLHEAGIPLDALQLLLGDGERVGAALARDSRIDGICFTGSIEVAQHINRSSANADPRSRLIAETGGINAMIVDSTALPEQSVRDIITSAFYSAGQRCSALRIVYLQDDIADRFIAMLLAAMNTLRVGDPWNWETDIGPVIDSEAMKGIDHYISGNVTLHSLHVPREGNFIPPTIIEVKGIESIEREIFGPVLHIARYRASELEGVIEKINESGYGLTFSIHSRLTRKVDRVIERLNVGNIYINRNQIGAVVESQPFGGQGLSGTGPKAGGPNYLRAFTKSGFNAAIAPTMSELPALSAADLDKAIAECSKNVRVTGPDLLNTLHSLFPDSKVLASCATETNSILPGPTGERNIYELRGVGVCLCLGPGANNALTQALQAISLGGIAVLCCAATEELQGFVNAIRGLNIPAVHLEGFPSPDALRTCSHIDAVSYLVSDSTEEEGRIVRNALRKREGVIVRFISELICPIDYAHEIHVCNDITSAGGNVELMTVT